LAQHDKSNVVPGAWIQVLAHNAYPDHGKYGKSVVIHGGKNVSADDPTLETYFFPKVAPLMEKAIQKGDKSKWP
jgi:hypothetical protein